MSKTPFAFGSTNTTSSSGLFGQPSASNPPASSNATTPSLFGTVPNPQQSSLFGGSTQPASTANPFSSLSATTGSQKPPTFGSSTATPASGTSTPSLFGASTGNATGAGLFSGGNTTGASSPFSSTGFTFAKKAEEKKDDSNTTAPGLPTSSNTETPPQPSSGSAFGAQSPFGAVIPSSSVPPGSTTPATSKPGGLFNFATSTTPAGPPPTDTNAGPKPSLFSSTQPSGPLFGGQKSLDSVSKPTTTQSNNLFGGASTNTASSGSLLGSKSTAPVAGGSLFGGLGGTKAATTDSAVPSTSSTTAPKPSFNFTSTPTVSSPSTITQAPNPFAAVISNSSAPTTTAPATAPTFFGGAASTTSSGSVSTAPTSLFSNGGKPNTSAFATSSAPTTTTSAPAQTLFGQKATQAPTQATTPATSQATGGTAPATSVAEKGSTSAAAPAATGGLGGSFSNSLAPSSVGPAPQLSRLKNKTMDEIITRWATDLSNYQKDFQNQAAKVASWDRLLVDNGDKIQKLYTSTFEAERASAEVERQLASVESQQDELTAWLDHYEREVDDMFVKQVGHGETLQGPDQERERTYKLAEKLTDRLDEMGRDLTSMIQEINTASATLTKSSKPDDPLSQIVRVLNGHLSQLQWIDQNAAALQVKIAAAQKAGQTIGSNGYGATENDPADDFYRSYMGRRG